MTNAVIIDDSRIDRLIIRKALEQGGISSILVCDHECAIETLTKVKPDVVVLDINLYGGVSGFDLVTEIKRHNDIKDIPIVFVSGGYDEDEAPERIIGVIDYIDKPIDMAKLIDVVSKNTIINKIDHLWAQVKEEIAKLS